MTDFFVALGVLVVAVALFALVYKVYACEDENNDDVHTT
jgi:hypothetical protein